ncbi:guanitoxin biosynthesis heme-dependent pre-guanitoxin N-hydroxylase GntA [Sphingosinicella sp.]|uniref:guanitoxin biosynthesis heme-dependent pre-guanitoxin N-hydroxylase GntA n=1 Tax=Sphingosinicella sp. TaxID=1917971 RepID=UPI0025FABEFC|nr:guanitoxin biosynthesis heme-dependent pre-guanitoxin N-hydroxylase GntA [Sphingosinicella sp.]
MAGGGNLCVGHPFLHGNQFRPKASGAMTVVTNPAELEEGLYHRISDPSFPCVGAKSAMARGTLSVLTCYSLTSGWDDLRIHQTLLHWAADYRSRPDGLRSLAVVFGGPASLNEQEFEAAMWERIQSFADKDHWLGQPYDRRVSADPDDPHFSLSFGGEAFFVVGLHPHASRPARRFPSPTLVFNLHEQFEQLREEGKYEGMREKILERDRALAGDINPMLARHGEKSEARQYSGRQVPPDWRCPFRDPRA